MKIAAVVGVKDERQLIRPCLERLWACGVGPVLVLDDRSSDGTAEIVDALVDQAPAPLTRVHFDFDFEQNLRRGGRALGPFLEHHKPDWLLFTDADEFLLLSPGRTLGAILAAQTGAVVAVERFNVPLMPSPFEPASDRSAQPYLDADIITGRERLSRVILNDDPGKRWIMHAINPKLICRPDAVADFGVGWHTAFDAKGDKIDAPALCEPIIVHVPMTTRERFVRKVDNARIFFSRWADHYPGEAAWQWKRWIDLADRGVLDAEFEAQRMDAATLAVLRREGVIETAGAFLERRLAA